MKKVFSIFTVLFFLAMFSTIALADPVLSLDASDNPGHPDVWTNLGAAGGELSGEGNPPILEQGDIEIPATGLVMPGAMFYTAVESGQCYGGPGNTVELFVEDWTLEFLIRLNGEDMLGEEHQLAGFQTDPPEGQQGMRIWLEGDEVRDTLGLSIHSGGSKQAVEPIDVKLEVGVWTWVTIVGTSESIMVYRDGAMLNEQLGFPFDPAVPLATIIIGANSYGERARTFNGSFALVRVHDMALSEAEVLGNMGGGGGAAVEPDSKLTTTWGTVKTDY